MAPETIEVSKSTDNLRLSVKQSYDEDGNLVELAKNKGSYITYIYGYNNTLPVAEIKGARLADVSSSYIAAIKTASNQDNDHTTDISDAQRNNTTYIGKEGELRQKLHKLYTPSNP